MLNADNEAYYGFTGPQRLDKAVHSLHGILKGIAADGRIEPPESDALNTWLSQHNSCRRRHPFSELVPEIETALSDGVLDGEELQDLIWLCERMTEGSRYYDNVTNDMQRLHGIMGGIGADGIVNREELDALSAWMEEHEHLRSCWPYDELETLIMDTMKDGKIDKREHERLVLYFGQFVNMKGQRAIAIPEDRQKETVRGVCATCPEIEFNLRCFCFTGKSQRMSRPQLAEMITVRGGSFSKSLSKDVHYLIIGADGNECWTYACYGRKVERAVELRRKGAPLLLVHEFDFWDAVEDCRV